MPPKAHEKWREIPHAGNISSRDDSRDDEGVFDGRGGGGGNQNPSSISQLPLHHLACSLHGTQRYGRIAVEEDDDEKEEDEDERRQLDACDDEERGGRKCLAYYFGAVAIVATIVLAVSFSIRGAVNRQSRPEQDTSTEPSKVVTAPINPECACACDETVSGNLVASNRMSIRPEGELSVVTKQSPRQEDGYNAPDSSFDGPFRAFDPWEGDFPCYEPPNYGSHKWETEEYKNVQDGIFYVKVPKTGSSTLSGIALRIAHRKGREILQGRHKMCNVEEAHGSAYGKWRYDRLDKSRSFLYSFIREPTKRSVSMFFYKQVSRLKVEPTDTKFLNWTRHNTNGNYQIDYLKLKERFDSNEHAVEHILSNYNFVGITERMDESLVVLQMLLGLRTADILHSSSKAAGGFAYVHNNKTPRCVYATPKFVSPTMETHFQSKEWLHHIRGDLLLYRAANRSLDATIKRLGRDEFDAKLIAFREARALAQKRCADAVIYPCSPGGELLKDTNCYEADKGCGYPCLDEVAKELEGGMR